MNNQVFFSNNSFCHNPRDRNLNHMYIKKVTSSFLFIALMWNTTGTFSQLSFKCLYTCLFSPLCLRRSQRLSFRECSQVRPLFISVSWIYVIGSCWEVSYCCMVLVACKVVVLALAFPFLGNCIFLDGYHSKHLPLNPENYVNCNVNYERRGGDVFILLFVTLFPPTRSFALTVYTGQKWVPIFGSEPNDVRI